MAEVAGLRGALIATIPAMAVLDVAHGVRGQQYQIAFNINVGGCLYLLERFNESQP
ncbi:hypothetical protein ABZN20_10510 [Methylococcus sp. ANG]|uniref:hypothetical protein n=1 Tax=Methylococcus sp. ANG TaxID=3231903 RepID=UPI003458CD6F